MGSIQQKVCTIYIQTPFPAQFLESKKGSNRDFISSLEWMEGVGQNPLLPNFFLEKESTRQ